MNIYDLISRAQKLRKETQLDSVSPDRVGGLQEDTLKYINEFQLLASSPSLHKIYASVSAMQSDKSPKSDLTGKLLKPGQLVVIVPANQTDATAGDVYRYDGPSGNTSAWTFVAKIGAVPADAELSATSTNPPQNKVVTEKLTELESEFRKPNNIINSWIQSSGAIVSSFTDNRILKVISVKKGDSIEILANDSSSAYYGIYENLSDTSTREELPKGKSVHLIVDKDGFLAVNDTLSTSVFLPKSIKINNLDVLQDYSQSLAENLNHIDIVRGWTADISAAIQYHLFQSIRELYIKSYGDYDKFYVSTLYKDSNNAYLSLKWKRRNSDIEESKKISFPLADETSAIQIEVEGICSLVMIYSTEYAPIVGVQHWVIVNDGNVTYDIIDCIDRESSSFAQLDFNAIKAVYIKRPYANQVHSLQITYITNYNNRCGIIAMVNGERKSYLLPFSSNFLINCDLQVCEVLIDFSRLDAERYVTINIDVEKCDVVDSSEEHKENFADLITKLSAKGHIFAEFSWKSMPEFVSNTTILPLVNVGGTIAGLYPRKKTFYKGQVYRGMYEGIFSDSMKSTSISGYDYLKNTGCNAFWMQLLEDYKTQYADMVVKTSPTSIVFQNGSTIVSEIPISETMSMNSLVDAINELPFIEAHSLYTHGKLAKDIYHSEDLNIPVLLDSNIYPIVIPYELDSEWHTIEILYDESNIHVAIDGITLSHQRKISSSDIVFGGMYNNAAIPVLFRYAHIASDWEDAELVQSIPTPYTSVNPQIISNNNPRLLIFEGHGTGESQIKDEMETSTDRYLSVFEKAKEMGYQPVSWHDIVAWKKGLIKLPKRCYNVMMDDFRVGNFINPTNRFPFSLYGVKGGLALMRNNADVAVTIDGIEYSKKDAIEIVRNGGWFCASHFDHRDLATDEPKDYINNFKNDIVEGDRLGIDSTIIVYPLGSVTPLQLTIFKEFGASLGVDIYRNNSYNCKGVDDMYLCRVAIQNSYTIDVVLSTLV